MPRKRHFFLVAAAILAVAAFAGFGAFRSAKESDFDRSPLGLANTLIEGGEYARAAETLRAAYRAHPDDPLRMELARAQLAAGDHLGAFETLRGEFAHPDIERAADYLRAETLLRLRRFDEAGDLAASLMAQFADGRTLLIGARAAYGAGAVAEAEALVAKALRVGGAALGDVWLFRARLALDANDMAAATAAAARAREAGAHRRDLAALDIEFSIREGRYEEAARAVAQLRIGVERRVNMKDPLADYLSGMRAAAEGDYIMAAREFRSADRWLGVLPNGPLALAMMQDQAGDTAQADESFSKLLAEAPHNALNLAAAGEQLVATGRFEEAAAMIGETDGAAPAGAYLRLLLAQALDDNDAALAAARSFAESAFPSSPAETVFGPHSDAAQQGRARYQRAKALAEAARVLLIGDTRLAARTARSLDAIADAPSMAALAGELYLAADKDAEAAAAFDRALQQAPGFAAALRGRVRVAVRAGALGEAERMLGAALEGATDPMPARELLARVLMVDTRYAEAAAVLGPAESVLVGAPRGALFYSGVLDAAGEGDGLAAFARAMRRARPADPSTVAVLDRAGLPDEAAAAAREALLAAPDARQRVAAYHEMMRKADKTAQAESFLAALGARVAYAAAPRGPEKADEGLDALRRAYLAAPENARAISRYGTALAQAGAAAESARVMREACFWATFGGCAEETPPRI